jgi:hypothetical protein
MEYRMIHDLKCLPMYFGAVLSGAKKFEVRKDDRPFAVGDDLLIREWDGAYTGRECTRRITYVLRGFDGISTEYCVLGMEAL